MSKNRFRIYERRWGNWSYSPELNWLHNVNDPAIVLDCSAAYVTAEGSILGLGSVFEQAADMPNEELIDLLKAVSELEADGIILPRS